MSDSISWRSFAYGGIADAEQDHHSSAFGASDFHAAQYAVPVRQSLPQGAVAQLPQRYPHGNSAQSWQNQSYAINIDPPPVQLHQSPVQPYVPVGLLRHPVNPTPQQVSQQVAKDVYKKTFCAMLFFNLASLLGSCIGWSVARHDF